MKSFNRESFLEEYKKLCEKYKCFIDTGFKQSLYLMKFQYPVDDNYLRTIGKLEEDLG